MTFANWNCRTFQNFCYFFEFVELSFPSCMYCLDCSTYTHSGLPLTYRWGMYKATILTLLSQTNQHS